MARPGDQKRRSETRQKTEFVQKRVTPEQKAEFEERALAAGFSSAQDYLAAFVLGEIEMNVREERDLRKLLGHVGKMGSNLNQLAHAVNAGRLKELGAGEARLLSDIDAGLKATRTTIRKAFER